MKKKFTDKAGNIVSVVDDIPGTSVKVFPIGFALKDAKPISDAEWNKHLKPDNTPPPTLESLAKDIADIKAALATLTNNVKPPKS